MFPDRFNLATYLLDHNLDAGRADKPALLWRDESHTYGELVDASTRLGHAFVELGLRMEERVLLALPDRPEFCHAWFATLRTGAVFAMVNTVLTDDDYRYYLDYTRARIAVVAADKAETFARLAAESPHLRAIVVAGDDSSTAAPDLAPARAALGDAAGRVSVHAMCELIAAADPTPFVADTHLHDVAGWLFTSGSTGHPKAAVHFHEDFAFNIEQYAKGVLGIREDDVTVGVPKLFFGYATGTNLMFPFAVGATTALFSERSTPEVVFEACTRYKPTILTSVPTMIGKMLALDAEQGPFDLSALRLVLSAGEKLPDHLQEQWMERFGVEILDGIGSAELFHIYISNRPGAVRFGSLGQVVPGYDCRVVDDDGNEVPRGDAGRLWVRGESAALCYWHDHEKSKATFAGDLVMTGDMFRQDADGYFYYEGRADELLKVGGVWVAPHQIEDCLLAHDDVVEAAVVGWRDADDLEKPKAFVVLAPGASGGDERVAELQAWVKQNLAPYKYPRWIEFLDDLPKNDRGKVDRKALRARA